MAGGESEFWPYYLQFLLLKTQSTHRILKLNGRPDPFLAAGAAKGHMLQNRITFEPISPHQLPLPVSIMFLYGGSISIYKSLLGKEMPTEAATPRWPLAHSFGYETPHLLKLTGPEILATR